MRRSERTPSATSWLSIVPRRPSDWRTGSAATNQPKPCRDVDQPVVAQHLERPAHGHAAGAVLARQLRFARQQAAGAELASVEAGPELVGDLLVAGLAHLSYTCLHQGAGATTRTRPSATGPERERGAHHGRRRQHPHRVDRRRLRPAARTGRRGPRTSRAPAHLRREGARQPPPRSRGGGRAGQVLQRPRPGPGRHAGRDRPDGPAAVHDRRAGPGGGPLDGPLRPPHPGPRGRQGRPPGRARDQPRGLRLPRIGLGPLRHRLLEARLGHHPPGRARAVRLPRRDDDRHRQPHTQRRGPRHGGDRGRRRRRRRRDDQLPVQRALAEAHRRAPHRRAQRLVRAEGHHLEGGRDPDRARAEPAPSSSTSARVRSRSAARARRRSATWAPRSAPPPPSSRTTPRWRATSGRRGARTSRRPPTGSPRTSGPTTRCWPTRAGSSTRSSRSTSPRSNRSSTGPTRPTGPGRCRRWPRRPGPRDGPARSAPPSSARAPTPATRTSPAPPASPARRLPPACAAAPS